MTVRVNGVALTALPMPRLSPGGTDWSWKSKVDGSTRALVVVLRPAASVAVSVSSR